MLHLHDPQTQNLELALFTVLLLVGAAAAAAAPPPLPLMSVINGWVLEDSIEKALRKRK